MLTNTLYHFQFRSIANILSGNLVKNKHLHSSSIVTSIDKSVTEVGCNSMIDFAFIHSVSSVEQISKSLNLPTNTCETNEFACVFRVNLTPWSIWYRLVWTRLSNSKLMDLLAHLIPGLSNTERLVDHQICLNPHEIKTGIRRSYNQRMSNVADPSPFFQRWPG